jgi:hypothetical protein
MSFFKAPWTAPGSAVALVLAGMLSPAPAQAAVISFLQNGYGAVPQVTISGFDIQTPDQVPPTPNFAQVVQSTTGIFTNPTPTPTLASTTYYVALVDAPGGSLLAVESITLQVTNDVTTVTNVTFQADQPGAIPAPAGGYLVATAGNIILTDSFYPSIAAGALPVTLPTGLTLTASLPEPASLVLLAGGLAGLGLLRRRKV